MKWVKKYRYLLTNVVAYVCMLLMPVFIIGFFWGNKFLNEYKEKVAAHAMHALLQTRLGMDEQLSQMNDIAIAMSNREMFQKIPKQSDPGLTNKMVKEINLNTNISGLVDDILLYIHDDQRVYTSAGTVSYDVFFNEVTFVDNDNNDLEKILTSANNVRLIEESEYKVFGTKNHFYIGLIMPFPSNNYAPYGNLMYLINSKKVDEFFGNEIDEKVINSYMISDDNKVLFSSEGYELNLTDRFIKLDKEMVEYDEYIVFQVHSNVFPFYYVQVLNKIDVYSDVESIKDRMILILAGIMILGVFMLFMFMRLNYLPVKRIQEIISKDKEDKSGYNEIEWINHAIADMSKQSIQLKMKLQENKEAVKEFLIHSVMRGDMNTKKEFNDYGLDFSISLKHEAYMVGMVLFEQAVSDLNSFIEELENDMKPCICFGSLWNEKKSIILLFNFEEESINRVREQCVKTVNGLIEEYDTRILLGLSNVYLDFDLSQQSFREANVVILREDLFKEKCVVCYYDVVIDEKQLYMFSRQEMEKLTHALKANDINTSKMLLDSIIFEISNKKSPGFIRKSLFYETVLILMNKLKMGNSEQANLDMRSIYIMDETNKMISLIKELYSYCRLEMDTLAIKGEFAKEVHKKIQDNYLNMSFSVQELADMMGLSPSSLSIRFKEIENQNISEYIFMLRLRKAKEMLVQTKAPIKSIVSEIGYIDVSSFSRKFKKVVGVSPSDYRKIGKEE